MSIDESSADRNVQIWKVKKLIKSLEAARGYVSSNASINCLSEIDFLFSAAMALP